MAESDINEFVTWYLNREGYRKTARLIEKSVGIKKEKLSKKKIKKFKKILKKLKKEKDWLKVLYCDVYLLLLTVHTVFYMTLN